MKEIFPAISHPLLLPPYLLVQRYVTTMVRPLKTVPLHKHIAYPSLHTMQKVRRDQGCWFFLKTMSITSELLLSD